MMMRLAARYPGYGWEHNQGYATRDHRDAIRRQGLTPFHRRSFLALQRTLAGDQISLDLFDEEVADVAGDQELGELQRLDGIRTPDVEKGLDPFAAAFEADDDTAAAIAAAEALVREPYQASDPIG
jgi:hypothetical protein